MSIKNKFRTLFSVEDEEYYEEYQPYRPSNLKAIGRVKIRKKDRKNVVSLQSVQPQLKLSFLNLDLTMKHRNCRSYCKRRSVVINLQRSTTASKANCRFLSGTVYAVSGDIKSGSTYVSVYTR